MEDTPKKCFVIQPFNEKFNTRYRDVFQPAITSAGLQPYRVDEDFGVVAPINSIQEEIRNSSICLADITLDNPNVWYELGYAHAIGKDVVMLCGSEREGDKFPFDVRHLTINRYDLSSLPSYDKLKDLISNRLTALLKKQNNVKHIIQSPLNPVEGLEPYETTALALVMENSVPSFDGAFFDEISRNMQSAGFTKIAVTLSLESLIEKTLIEITTGTTSHDHAYASYTVTSAGKKWLLQNKDKLQLTISHPQPSRPKPPQKSQNPYPLDDFDDSDPFADE